MGSEKKEKAVKSEVLSLRAEIPIEELKTKKNQLDILAMASPVTGVRDEFSDKYEAIARLNDTAILNHAKWQQEHNLSSELAKALLIALATPEDKTLKQKYLPLLEKAKKYKCFELDPEDYKTDKEESLLILKGMAKEILFCKEGGSC